MKSSVPAAIPSPGLWLGSCVASRCLQASSHLLVQHLGFWALVQVLQGSNLKGSISADQGNMEAKGMAGKSALAVVGPRCAEPERLSSSSPHRTLPLPAGSCKALKGCVNYGGATNKLIFGTGTVLSVEPSTWVVGFYVQGKLEVTVTLVKRRAEGWPSNPTVTPFLPWYGREKEMVRMWR